MEELADTVNEMVTTAGVAASRELLKTTAASTLMLAMAWPVALVSAANMIDGTWTLTIGRADDAGIELANVILESANKSGAFSIELFPFL